MPRRVPLHPRKHLPGPLRRGQLLHPRPERLRAVPCGEVLWFRHLYQLQVSSNTGSSFIIVIFAVIIVIIDVINIIVIKHSLTYHLPHHHHHPSPSPYVYIHPTTITHHHLHHHHLHHHRHCLSVFQCVYGWHGMVKQRGRRGRVLRWHLLCSRHDTRPRYRLSPPPHPTPSVLMSHIYSL